MNRLFLIPCLALIALAVAGCDMTTDNAPSPTATKIASTVNMTVAKIQAGVSTAEAYVAKVQTISEKVCGYVPTLATVVGIVNSGFGLDVALIGNAVCNAVTTLPLADGPGDHKPRVNGVIVKGRFVK